MMDFVASARATARKKGIGVASIITAGLLATMAVPAAAQVSVAPTALFLTGQERFGGLYISNSSASPQEVTVEFRFGYPAADSTGAVAMQYGDSVRAERFSIASAVRAFPQRFILPPGETQVVRLTAEPSGNPEDGLYWTRVVTTSTPQVEFQADDDVQGIQTRVQFRLQQVTALFYRQGQTTVRMSVNDLEASVDSTSLSLVARIDHEGNSPFFGTARIRVLDGDRNVVAEETQAIAIYASERRRIDIARPALEAGSYTVELTLTSERNDLPQDQLTRIEPVSGETQVIVPSAP